MMGLALETVQDISACRKMPQWGIDIRPQGVASVLDLCDKDCIETFVTLF